MRQGGRARGHTHTTASTARRRSARCEMRAHHSPSRPRASSQLRPAEAHCGTDLVEVELARPPLCSSHRLLASDWRRVWPTNGSSKRMPSAGGQGEEVEHPKGSFDGILRAARHVRHAGARAGGMGRATYLRRRASSRVAMLCTHSDTDRMRVHTVGTRSSAKIIGTPAPT